MTFEMLRDTVDRQDAEIKRLRRENEALEVMHFTRLRDAWITLANRCELFLTKCS